MALVMSILFPYAVTLAFSGTAAAGEQEENGMDSGRRILLDRETPGYADLEDYLVGVVARQMPAEYEKEALKAQAIIARTYIVKQMGEETEIAESSLDLDILEKEQLKNLWGTQDFAEFYQKIENAVNETAGQVITWEGELIDPLFCRASSGKTRQGDELHPYLQPVNSPKDVEAEGFLTVTVWTKEEFAEKLSAIPEGEGISADSVPGCVQIGRRDESGYIEEIQVGSLIHSGETVQYALGLPSPDFTIEEYEGNIRAASSGVGHGYGLSQYGANERAKEGWTAQDILEYYYKNIVLISE